VCRGQNKGIEQCFALRDWYFLQCEILPFSTNVDSERRAAQMETVREYPLELGIILAIVLSLVLELGRRLGIYLRIAEETTRKEQTATIRDGLFVLVSLLLGFTLALAAPRYAERRALLVEETVSIGATYLRTSTLPEPYRSRSRSFLSPPRRAGPCDGWVPCLFPTIFSRS
jgi:hypothetical protein